MRGKDLPWMAAILAKSLGIWLNTSRKGGISSASWSSTLPELGLNDVQLLVLHLPCGLTPVILQVFSLGLWLFKVLFPLSLRFPPPWTEKLLESLGLQCVDDFSWTAASNCASKSNKKPLLVTLLPIAVATQCNSWMEIPWFVLKMFLYFRCWDGFGSSAQELSEVLWKGRTVILARQYDETEIHWEYQDLNTLDPE